MMQTAPPTSPKRRLKRRRLLVFGLPAVLLLAALCKIFFSPIPRNAYPILSTSRWTTIRPGDPPYYVWLANGDIAHLERNARGMFQICYQRANATGPVGGVRYGPELPSDAAYHYFTSSPGGKAIAYLRVSASQTLETVVLSAEGKELRTAPGHLMGWLPNEQGFLTQSPSAFNVLEIHSLDPKEDKNEMIQARGPVYQPLPIDSIASGPDFLVGGSLSTASTVIRSISARPPYSDQKRWQVEAPLQLEEGIGETRADFAIPNASPDRRHLLWRVYFTKPPRWRQWLGRFVPRLRSKQETRVGYALSDMQGHNVHPLLNTLVHEAELYPFWTPDSKHISFIYHDQLYLMPID